MKIKNVWNHHLARVCYWKKPAVHLFFYHWSGIDPNPEAFPKPSVRIQIQELRLRPEFSCALFGLDGFFCANKKDWTTWFFVKVIHVFSLRLKKINGSLVFFNDFTFVAFWVDGNINLQLFRLPFQMKRADWWYESISKSFLKSPWSRIRQTVRIIFGGKGHLLGGSSRELQVGSNHS